MLFYDSYSDYSHNYPDHFGLADSRQNMLAFVVWDPRLISVPQSTFCYRYSSEYHISSAVTIISFNTITCILVLITITIIIHNCVLLKLLFLLLLL